MNKNANFGVLDELIPLSRAARLLPGRPNPSTIWSWAARGITVGEERIFLKVYKLGRRLLVHPADVQEFALRAGAAQRAAWDAGREAEAVAR